MRFLADENMPGDLVEALADSGQDIPWVRLEAPSMNDAAVLAWAMREGRILLTFDKDFGELVRGPFPNSEFGVILLRIPMPRIGELQSELLDLLMSRTDWAGAFSVITPDRVRMRRLGS